LSKVPIIVVEFAYLLDLTKVVVPLLTKDGQNDLLLHVAAVNSLREVMKIPYTVYKS
jgi:hypothetical protein